MYSFYECQKCIQDNIKLYTRMYDKQGISIYFYVENENKFYIEVYCMINKRIIRKCYDFLELSSRLDSSAISILNNDIKNMVSEVLKMEKEKEDF